VAVRSSSDHAAVHEERSASSRGSGDDGHTAVAAPLHTRPASHDKGGTSVKASPKHDLPEAPKDESPTAKAGHAGVAVRSSSDHAAVHEERSASSRGSGDDGDAAVAAHLHTRPASYDKAGTSVKALPKHALPEAPKKDIPTTAGPLAFKCDEGQCDQVGCERPTCDGGGCNQAGSLEPDCAGGKCNQVGSLRPLCAGGHCSH